MRGNGLIELIVCVCVGEVQECFPICNNTVYISVLVTFLNSVVDIMYVTIYFSEAGA